MIVNSKVLLIYLALLPLCNGSSSCDSKEKDACDGNNNNPPANNVPVLVNLPNKINISENSDLGMFVFKVIATDDDTSDNLTCNISREGAMYFNINHTMECRTYRSSWWTNTRTNRTCVCNVTTSAINIIDFENFENTTIDLEITVSDGKDIISGQLTVEITDQNEAPIFPQSSYTISGDEGEVISGLLNKNENMYYKFETLHQNVYPQLLLSRLGIAIRRDLGFTFPVSSAVMATCQNVKVYVKVAGSLSSSNFNVTDPEGEVLRFEMDCGINNRSFSMNQSNGQVKFASSYDLDTKNDSSIVSCVVMATDGILSVWTNLSIIINPVNEYDPVFLQPVYTFFVEPDANISTLIGTVSATDLDTGPHGDVTYTLTEPTTNRSYFSLSSTGEIYLQQTFPNNTEIGDVFNITVIATDGGGRNESVVVLIVVSGPTTPRVWTSVPLTGRYVTFWDDPRNISWVTLVICFSVIAVCVVVYIFYDFFGSPGYVVMRTSAEERPTVTVLTINAISGSSIKAPSAPRITLSESNSFPTSKGSCKTPTPRGLERAEYGDRFF